MKTVWIALTLICFVVVGASNSYLIHGRKGAWLPVAAVAAVRGSSGSLSASASS